MKFRLAGITDLGTLDWPGKLATIVFFQGCDLRCPWCQNVEGIDPRGGKEATTEGVIEHIKKQKPLIDSVVLTGGEPLLQPEACLSILKAARELGLSCAIETNATNPKALKPLLPHLQFSAMDIKAPLSDPGLYDKVTGSTKMPGLVQRVKESLMLVMDSEVRAEARVTIVPTLNDAEDIIARIAEDVKGIGCLRLQQFRNQRTFDPAFQKLSSPSREKMIKLAKVAKRRGIEKVKIFTAKSGLEEV